MKLLYTLTLVIEGGMLRLGHFEGISDESLIKPMYDILQILKTDLSELMFWKIYTRAVKCYRTVIS